MLILHEHFKLIVTDCIPYPPEGGPGGRVKAVFLRNGFGHKPWIPCGSFNMDATIFTVFSEALYKAQQSGHLKIVFDDQKFYDFLKDNSEIL